MILPVNPPIQVKASCPFTESIQRQMRRIEKKKKETGLSHGEVIKEDVIKFHIF